ncbi:hypothetical protein JHV675_51860 [Mycobacterium avium subsp. hominissuis]
MFEVSRHPALNDALQHQFLDQRRVPRHLEHHRADGAGVVADLLADIERALLTLH